MQKLLTVKEVAEVLRLSPFTIKRMLKTGVLSFVRLNCNIVRIREGDLQNLIELRVKRNDYWKAARQAETQQTNR